MSKNKKQNNNSGGWGRETYFLFKKTKEQSLVDNRDMFGTPKNRSKTWDIKKSRDPKQDRRKSKKDLHNENSDNI
jgi:hypothetical protein